MSRWRLLSRAHRRLGRFAARQSLLEALPKGSVGAEIGVFRGDFASRMLSVVQPARLHLIDPWRFPDDERYAGASWGGRIARSQGDMDAVYESVLRRFALPIEAGLVIVHRCGSAEAGEGFPDEYFDWVYIDANHLYEYVKRDLEIFTRKVRRGGFVAGDDYAIAGWWEDGVRRAVDELVATGACEAVSLGEQFILRRA